MPTPSLLSKKWPTRWDAFRRPVNPEKASVLRARRAAQPEELRTANQISGRHLTHCGFTLGASFCSFHCTLCYLPKNTNDVPLPSLADMKEQINANRRLQGPGGGLQLTWSKVYDQRLADPALRGEAQIGSRGIISTAAYSQASRSLSESEN